MVIFSSLGLRSPHGRSKRRPYCNAKRPNLPQPRAERTAHIHQKLLTNFLARHREPTYLRVRIVPLFPRFPISPVPLSFHPLNPHACALCPKAGILRPRCSTTRREPGVREMMQRPQMPDLPRRKGNTRPSRTSNASKVPKPGK